MRQHYKGFPKVELKEPRVFNGKVITHRPMDISELYDYYQTLPDIQKKTSFLN